MDKNVMTKTKPDGIYPVNHCRGCGRLLTKLEILDVFAGKRPIPLCPCGKNSFSPANLRWYEWSYPRVWKLAVAQLRGTLPPSDEPLAGGADEDSTC